MGGLITHLNLKKKKLKWQQDCKDDFYKIIKFIGKENILDSDEFLNRHKEKISIIWVKIYEILFY